jgi:hypothetical protein
MLGGNTARVRARVSSIGDGANCVGRVFFFGCFWILRWLIYILDIRMVTSIFEAWLWWIIICWYIIDEYIGGYKNFWGTETIFFLVEKFLDFMLLVISLLMGMWLCGLLCDVIYLGGSDDDGCVVRWYTWYEWGGVKWGMVMNRLRGLGGDDEFAWNSSYDWMLYGIDGVGIVSSVCDGGHQFPSVNWWIWDSGCWCNSSGIGMGWVLAWCLWFR